MQTKTFQTKLQRKRWVEHTILRYLKDKTFILEDLVAEHSGYYQLPIEAVEDADTIILCDWHKIHIISKADLASLLVPTTNSMHLRIKRSSLLKAPTTKTLDRWF